MGEVVGVIQQKGGVGKTTVAINLGAALARDGRRVLLVDLDPQGHLTEGVGLQDAYLADGPSLYQALVEPRGPRLADLVRPHRCEPFSVIPASYQLMLAEQALFMARNREHKLGNLLAPLAPDFDWVLLDCPPALGNLTDNAINAARQVVIPIQAEPTSVRALELLFDQIESLERGLDIRVRVLAVVPNLVQDSALSRKILADLRSSIDTVTDFELRKRVLFQVAWNRGCSIFGYRPASTAEERTRGQLADLYERLADVVRARAGGASHGG